MTIDEARAIVLSLPDAVEGQHHGHPDFRIGKSIYGSLWPEKGTCVLRLPPPIAESLEAENPAAYRIASRSGMFWVSITLSNTDEEAFRPLAEIAHEQMQEEKRKKK